MMSSAYMPDSSEKTMSTAVLGTIFSEPLINAFGNAESGPSRAFI